MRLRVKYNMKYKVYPTNIINIYIYNTVRHNRQQTISSDRSMRLRVKYNTRKKYIQYIIYIYNTVRHNRLYTISSDRSMRLHVKYNMKYNVYPIYIIYIIESDTTDNTLSHLIGQCD